MAVIGKNFSVLETGKFRLSGFPAFLAWGLIHLQYLGQASLRSSVLIQWFWSYFTGQGGSRLILPGASTTRQGEIKKSATGSAAV